MKDVIWNTLAVLAVLWLVRRIWQKMAYERFIGRLASREASHGLVRRYNAMISHEGQVAWVELRNLATPVCRFEDFHGGERPINADSNTQVARIHTGYVEMEGDVDAIVCRVCERYEQTLCQQFPDQHLVRLRMERDGKELALIPTYAEWRKGARLSRSVHLSLAVYVPTRGHYQDEEVKNGTFKGAFAAIEVTKINRGFEWSVLATATIFGSAKSPWNETWFIPMAMAANVHGTLVTQLIAAWESAVEAERAGNSLGGLTSAGSVQSLIEGGESVIAASAQPVGNALPEIASNRAHDIDMQSLIDIGTPKAMVAGAAFCVQCGESLSPKARFCSECGTLVSRGNSVS
jgi:hypothetical protein